MNHGKFSALEQLIKKDYSNVAGIVVKEKGDTLYENYFNQCMVTDTIHVFSVTKSIISLLIGIAIDKGYIKGVEQRVLDFFPDYKIKRGEKTIQQITLKHLLTMTAPYKYKSAPYTKYFTSDSWVKAALDLLGGKGQIGEFRYTPLIGPDILSGILANSTGQSVLDFAAENLFSPLGINVPGHIIFQSKEEQLAFTKAKNIRGWVADPSGVNTAGWGITLTARDMANLGQLMLQDGKWNGKQLVSKAWIRESTREHSRWEAMNLPYGYLWWIIDDEQTFAAMGDGGNTIYINKKKNLVVAIASHLVYNAKDRIALIKEHIEPILEEGV